MKPIDPMLLIDFYKAVHSDILPRGMTKSVSYFTPRYSRVDMWPRVVMFGLQSFCKTYLIDYFNENFFGRSEKEVTHNYERILDNCLGKGTYNSKKIKELHRLGHLPIEITALPEGTRVPMHVPMFGIANTHPRFAWLPQALESLISAEMWHPMISATVGTTYRDVVNKYYGLTCDDSELRAGALTDMSFRGQECLQSAIKSSAGWCLSFTKTATVPAILWLEQMYNCDCEKEPVAFGAISTEHSVMCSNYAIDGDEETLLRRLLNEVYPNASFSAVCDSYDYWNVVDNILPKLKPEIMAHNGCFLVRGDSGDCVDVVTRTVFKLWETIGGTINSKGYKVLDPHIRVIYADSITIQRAIEIYEILMKAGFACSNVVLGAGSFSMQCIEENGELKPFTRDTFSSCIKATYCEINNKPYPIFKDPKEGGFKTSQKGCCCVYETETGELSYNDGHDFNIWNADANLLKPIFSDGKILREQSLAEIRNILHKGRF